MKEDDDWDEVLEDVEAADDRDQFYKSTKRYNRAFIQEKNSKLLINKKKPCQICFICILELTIYLNNHSKFFNDKCNSNICKTCIFTNETIFLTRSLKS
ncbi:hypothetical protein BpHYR1_037557 [Brachionus plicatilis]|uniref:Uncharacterized protein n=1 Tax=Brachionus plicatilis TaxID=10195 RepID=A0A3M7QI80_BRAPC|nr:hypothetical protein BpHYR1_037557 [Brachionus plicatilis]